MKRIIRLCALASMMMLTACGIFSKDPRSSEYRKLLPEEMHGTSEQLLSKKGFIVSYNCDTKLPNWVFCNLKREHVDGTSARPGNTYYEDTNVPKPRATNSDYRRTDFVRGHMCPPDDNRWNKTAMRDSYTYSNIGPQTERCNSVWTSIEAMCREWAKEYNDIYVVSGPIVRKHHDIIGPNDVAVPEAYFKVVVCLNGRRKGIGFICENSNTKQTMKQCVVTIDEIERITGIDFFPRFSSKDRRNIEEKANLKDW